MDWLHDVLTIAVSVVVGIASSYVTFRMRFERFQAMDREREKHWTNWRQEISEKVGSLETRVEQLERTVVTHEQIAQMHKENQESLKEIARVIERNNEIAKQDRHDLRNAITPIALDVAVLKNKVLGDR